MAIYVTIKNMPPKLYEKLKVRAAAHRRSVNSEVIGCLEEVLIRPCESTEELLKKLEELRDRVSDAPPLTDKFLRKAKEEGRKFLVEERSHSGRD